MTVGKRHEAVLQSLVPVDVEPEGCSQADNHQHNRNNHGDNMGGSDQFSPGRWKIKNNIQVKKLEVNVTSH